MLVELQGRGSGSGEEVCVYVCERVHVRARERGGGGEGRECKLDVCQHIAYVQGLITNVSSLFGCGRGKKCSGSMGRASGKEKW